MSNYYALLNFQCALVSLVFKKKCAYVKYEQFAQFILIKINCKNILFEVISSSFSVVLCIFLLYPPPLQRISSRFVVFFVDLYYYFQHILGLIYSIYIFNCINYYNSHQ